MLEDYKKKSMLPFTDAAQKSVASRVVARPRAY